jgi:hypothetical protein
METVAIYLIYGFLFSLLLLLSGRSCLLFVNKSRRLFFYEKYIRLIIIFILYVSFIFFTVFRDFSVGVDTSTYLYIYRYISDFSKVTEAIIFSGFEPVFTVVFWIFGRVTDNYRIFLFFLYSFIFLFQVRLFKEKITFSFFSVVAYFSIIFLLLIVTSLSMMRNVFSIFVISTTYYYLNKNRYVPAFLLTLIGIGIHYSAVINLPVLLFLYIFDRKKFNLKGIVTLFVFLFFLSFLFIPIIKSIIISLRPHYGSYFVNTKLSIKSYIFFITVISICLLKWKELIHSNQINRIMFVSLLCTMFTIPIQLILEMAGRMLFFCYPATFFLLSEIWSISKLRNKNFFTNLCIRMILFVFMFYQITFSFFGNIFHTYGLDKFVFALF